MNRPGRTLTCSGDLPENAEIIAATFIPDGFTRVSADGVFPVHLRSGSAVWKFFGDISIGILARLYPPLRRRVVPADVHIHAPSGEPTALMVTIRSRQWGADPFLTTRLEALDTAVARLRSLGREVELGELVETARLDLA